MTVPGGPARLLKLFAKQILFPGLDLHTRCRYRFLSPLLRPGNLETLDAGFGNGALSYAAYRKGNRVIGLTLWEREVQDTVALFDRMNVPRDRVELRRMDIYDLRTLGRTFDQIVCSETLEHIARDGTSGPRPGSDT
jgi:2-polyprenyl-3-methyl-5-hydroxy-6-metoxy-1,4-benzoquinol methylase